MKLLATVIAIGCSALSAQAHEFWIESEDYALEPGDHLIATLRVGEKFQGTSYAFIPANFRLFRLGEAGAEPTGVDMRIGDRPALDAEVTEEGLTAVIYVSRDYELTWDSWDKFESFVQHKDAAWVLDEHAARDMPREDVREGYTRFAKALYSVGEGAGEDRAYGLLTEIVALENPYTGDMSDGLDVQLLFEREPRANAQIEIFSKSLDDDTAEAEISTVTTDEEGFATVPVEAGRQYLLDAVVFREPVEDLLPRFDPQWETLWASLTFGLSAD